MAKHYIRERLNEFIKDTQPTTIDHVLAAQIVTANATDARLDEIESMIEQHSYEAGRPRSYAEKVRENAPE